MKKYSFWDFLLGALGTFLIYFIFLNMTGLGFLISKFVHDLTKGIGLGSESRYVIGWFTVGFSVLMLATYHSIESMLANSEKAKKESEEIIKKANEYFQNKIEVADKYFKDLQIQFNKLIDDEKAYKPYLAEIFADYQYYIDIEIANYLERKNRPAYVAADNVKKIAREKKVLLAENKTLKYQMAIYENAFPWLEDFKEISNNDFEELKLTTTAQDEATDEYSVLLKSYLSPDEYRNLSSTEKYQMALDRYRNLSKKTAWRVGIDYERYVGHLYELAGYKVNYNGALAKLEDLGRDLIAEKKNEIVVIQCKYWKDSKVIREKHVFQLYGTMIMLKLENPKKKVIGEFHTTTKLSDMAKKVAQLLEIKLVENAKYDKNYPCVKCNISKKDGSKIYHLPFDQQYDKIDIEPSRGEMFAHSIVEAEQNGFRRAWKWKGITE